MTVLDKAKLLEAMTKRKNALYNQITRDFGGGLAGRTYEHMEVKYWKEAIERGEFDMKPEVSSIPCTFCNDEGGAYAGGLWMDCVCSINNENNIGGNENEKCRGKIQSIG